MGIGHLDTDIGLGSSYRRSNDGEDWNTELDGRLEDAPKIRVELDVLSVDPSKLKVRGK